MINRTMSDDEVVASDVSRGIVFPLPNKQNKRRRNWSRTETRRLSIGEESLPPENFIDVFSPGRMKKKKISTMRRVQLCARICARAHSIGELVCVHAELRMSLFARAFSAIVKEWISVCARLCARLKYAIKMLDLSIYLQNIFTIDLCHYIHFL